jgi:DNA-binding transcriptional MerR regulator
MSFDNLTIGALAAQTNCTISTIRYYEEIGLLPHATRASNGRRTYRASDLKRLTFIKRCRDFGFPIEQVRNLASLFDESDRACVEVRDMAQTHLDAVRTKLEEMRQLETSLLAYVDSCDAVCSGGVARDCTIMVDLSSGEPTPPTKPTGSCCARPSAGAPLNQPRFTELKRP